MLYSNTAVILVENIFVCEKKSTFYQSAVGFLERQFSNIVISRAIRSINYAFSRLGPMTRVNGWYLCNREIRSSILRLLNSLFFAAVARAPARRYRGYSIPRQDTRTRPRRKRVPLRHESSESFSPSLFSSRVVGGWRPYPHSGGGDCRLCHRGTAHRAPLLLPQL